MIGAEDHRRFGSADGGGPHADSGGGKKVRPLHKRGVIEPSPSAGDITRPIREKSLSLFRLFPQIRLDVPAQSFHHFLLAAFLDFSLNLFQREVDDVVMMEFEWHEPLAEPQPEAMDQVDLVGREIRRVRTQNLIDLVSIEQMNFEVELWFRIRQALPRIPDVTSLFFNRLLRRMPKNNCAGLQ